MKRKYRSKKIRIVGAVVFLALMIFSSVFVIWQMKTNEFGGLIDRIEEVFYGTPFKNAYNAKSLILVDLSNDEVFISKRENEQQLPASLAKLFVIKYAVTLADLDSIVSANYEAISLTKSGSSVANIKTKEYYLQNLFAAMLVPSGNDAAYVVADYCGGLLSPQAKNSQERINAFIEHLNDYLQEQGYDDTVLYDPSGFDTEARTTALDLKKVVEKLGAGLDDVLFTQVILLSNDDFPGFSSTYAKYFPNGYPARVATIAKEIYLGLRLELCAVVALGRSNEDKNV